MRHLAAKRTEPPQLDALLKASKAMSTALDAWHEQIAKAGKVVTETVIEIQRKSLAQAGFPMDEDSLNMRKIKAAQSAVVAEKGVAGRTPRTPQFRCKQHGVAMVFSQPHQLWQCPEQGCRNSRLPSLDPSITTLVKSPPRLIGRIDSDGDITWMLNFTDENIICELPFRMTTESVDGQNLSVTLTSDAVALFDERGNSVPLSKVTDPEDG